jgi:carboxylate-amine ligase
MSTSTTGRVFAIEAARSAAARLTAPAVPDGLLRAAHFNAAHCGLGGSLLDLRQGHARPTWDVVDAVPLRHDEAVVPLGRGASRITSLSGQPASGPR